MMDNKQNKSLSELLTPITKDGDFYKRLIKVLNSLHSGWTTINFNDESSEEEIKNLVTKRNKELNSLLK